MDDRPEGGMERLDGNVLAGALGELLTVDATTVRVRCAGCGRTGPVAETGVYDRAAGLVARCAGCDAVLLTVVRAPGRALVSLRGIGFLEVALPAGG